jgi:hypothetical protein
MPLKIEVFGLRPTYARTPPLLMPERSAPNHVVYREGRSHVCASAVLRQLENDLTAISLCFSIDQLLGALLRAGELECALVDADSEDAELAAAITDRLAEFACRADTKPSFSRQSVPDCLQLLNKICRRGDLTVSRPEGFAYYALHPLDFADMVSSDQFKATATLVIGIRSIGTTLSAVTTAKFRLIGVRAQRTTVRPSGHPYDRQTRFSAAQRQLVRHALSENAIFLVCDEGPGRSGSSLLSVAEALEQQGVPRDRIALLCSHEPNVNALCAPRAAERWQRYRCLATGLTRRLPAGADHYIGGGEWRNVILPQGSSWPATWPQIERLKFLTADGKMLFKFEGHGSYGERVRQTEEILFASGFGAAYVGQQSGFGIHKTVKGTYPRPRDVSPALLRHFARYCAWRVVTFPATVSEGDLRRLEHMARVNCEQELGFAPELHLELERPAICDSHLMPHEWITARENQWVKLDASSHGDDHFFPGPTDIAWDLAGLCVEWELSPEPRNSLIGEYARISGDKPARRLPAYELAYAAFRLGWTRMAAASVAGTPDEHLLSAEADRYSDTLNRISQPAAVFG